MAELRNIMLTLMMFVAVIVGFSGFTVDLMEQNSAVTTSQNLSQNAYIQATNNMTGKLEAIAVSTTQLSQSSGFGLITASVDFLTSSIGAVTIVFDTFSIFQNIIGESTSLIGVPAEFAGILFAMVLIVIVLGVLAVIMKAPI